MDEGNKKEVWRWGRDLILAVVIIPAGMAALGMTYWQMVMGGIVCLLALKAWESYSRWKPTVEGLFLVRGKLVPRSDGNTELKLEYSKFQKWMFVRGPMLFLSIVMIFVSAMIFSEYYRFHKPGSPIGEMISSQKSGLETFSPPAWAMKNDDGSPRVFVHEKIGDLMARFAKDTELQAQSAAAPYSGDWTTISGTVSEIDTAVFLSVRFEEGMSPPVIAEFPVSEEKKLSVYNPGEKLKAACKIRSVDAVRAILEDCRVVP